MTDYWKVCDRLDSEGWSHLTMNNNYNFVVRQTTIKLGDNY